MCSVIAAVIVGVAALPAVAQGNADVEKRLQKMYVEYLNEAGYRPFVDGDGDVQFKHEGSTYFIDVDEDDTLYFRLVLLGNLPEKFTRNAVLDATNYATEMAKVCKIYLRDGGIIVADVELFFDRPEDFQAVFERSLSAIDVGLNLFRTKLLQ
jgi:hypothetical protein